MKKSLLVLSLSLFTISVFAQSVSHEELIKREREEDSLAMVNALIRQATMQVAMRDSSNGKGNNLPSIERAKQKHYNDSVAAAYALKRNAVMAAQNNNSRTQNQAPSQNLSPAQTGFRKDSMISARMDGAQDAKKRAKLDSAKGLIQPLTEGITDKLYFIDANADNVLATIVNPTGPTPHVEWHMQNYAGTTVGLESFIYLGNNGSNYQTQLVVTPSTDPNKKYEVYFQSRKLYDTEPYHKGRVEILDYHMQPWVVTPEYSNDKGIVFKLSPLQKK